MGGVGENWVLLNRRLVLILPRMSKSSLRGGLVRLIRVVRKSRRGWPRGGLPMFYRRIGGWGTFEVKGRGRRRGFVRGLIDLAAGRVRVQFEN